MAERRVEALGLMPHYGSFLLPKLIFAILSVSIDIFRSNVSPAYQLLKPKSKSKSKKEKNRTKIEKEKSFWPARNRMSNAGHARGHACAEQGLPEGGTGRAALDQLATA